MATSSFYEMMVVETQEQVDRLVEAFRIADERGPLKNDSDIFERLEEGRRYLRSHPR
jgi:hypothetical protein